VLDGNDADSGELFACRCRCAFLNRILSPSECGRPCRRSNKRVQRIDIRDRLFIQHDPAEFDEAPPTSAAISRAYRRIALHAAFGRKTGAVAGLRLGPRRRLRCDLCGRVSDGQSASAYQVENKQSPSTAQHTPLHTTLGLERAERARKEMPLTQAERGST
jgi:hypothetical protein